MQRKKNGRPLGPPRIKVTAVTIQQGKAKHLFSVITLASVTQVLQALQQLRSPKPSVRRLTPLPTDDPYFGLDPSCFDSH
jgi:hypothetical protein